MNRSTRYFITGGGTGGHVYPAIAVVRELIEMGVNKDTQIFYLGNSDKLEYKVAKDEGLNFLSYRVSGMPRKLSLKIFVFLFQLIIAALRAFFYTLKYKPDVVFATGGYVCAPILIVSKILKIPYVLHDCDAYPGIVSKVFSSGAKGMSLAFSGAKKAVKCKNTQVLGNPIRKDFLTLKKEKAREILNIKKPFVILIMGGSSGAMKINDAALGVVEKFKNSSDIQIIWQSGRKNFDDVKSKLSQMPENLILEPYFDNMAIPLMAADLAVSRAGSLSISELCAAALPSILVPYPYAAQDHQRANARNMEELGASLYIDDNDLNAESLYKALNSFILNPDKLSLCARCAYENAKTNAVEKIVQLINEATNVKC